jgi:acetylornithine deacetylase
VKDHSPTPRLAIIGEPTSMRPVNGHKGILAFRTTVTGKEAHSSQTQLGASAIRSASQIVGFLYRLADELAEAADPDNGFTPPQTTINVGMIEGGTALNIIARDCAFTWDVRFIPSDDREAILQRIWDFIEGEALPALRAGAPDGTIETETLADAPALRPDPDGEAEQLVRQITGANDPGKVAFGTEAGLFQGADIPAVVIGPGDIAQAHAPDEFITRDQLDQGRAFLKKVADWASG